MANFNPNPAGLPNIAGLSASLFEFGQNDINQAIQTSERLFSVGVNFSPQAQRILIDNPQANQSPFLFSPNAQQNGIFPTSLDSLQPSLNLFQVIPQQLPVVQGPTVQLPPLEAQPQPQVQPQGNGNTPRVSNRGNREVDMISGSPERRQRLLNQFDANNDGRLGFQETKKSKEVIQRKAIERFDGNNDGRLSDKERNRLQKFRANKKAQRQRN